MRRLPCSRPGCMQFYKHSSIINVYLCHGWQYIFLCKKWFCHGNIQDLEKTWKGQKVLKQFQEKATSTTSERLETSACQSLLFQSGCPEVRLSFHPLSWGGVLELHSAWKPKRRLLNYERNRSENFNRRCTWDKSIEWQAFLYHKIPTRLLANQFPYSVVNWSLCSLVHWNSTYWRDISDNWKFGDGWHNHTFFPKMTSLWYPFVERGDYFCMQSLWTIWDIQIKGHISKKKD